MAYPTITGVGMALPERCITNDQFVDLTQLDTKDVFIQRLTGIEQRYWVDGAGEHTSNLGTEAARYALKMSGVNLDDVEGIYLSTASPDYISPSTASLVHEKLGAAEDCTAVDLNAACAGGVVAVQQAAGNMMAFGHNATLAIGSEILSAGIDMTDRRSAILFGDGAGAAVLQSQEGANQPYFAGLTRPDKDAIHIPGGGNAEPNVHPTDQRRKIAMQGKKVGAHAAYVMPTLAVRVAEKAGLYDEKTGINWDGIDYFVPHQANQRLIEGVADYLNVPEEKRIITVNQHANTSSASIFLAMAEARSQGQIEPGRKRVLMTAIGAGMVGASAIIDINLA